MFLHLFHQCWKWIHEKVCVCFFLSLDVILQSLKKETVCVVFVCRRHCPADPTALSCWCRSSGYRRCSCLWVMRWHEQHGLRARRRSSMSRFTISPSSALLSLLPLSSIRDDPSRSLPAACLPVLRHGLLCSFPLFPAGVSLHLQLLSWKRILSLLHSSKNICKLEKF